MEDIAFTFAADTTKQLISFSTAIITLTATFAKDTFITDGKSLPKTLAISWCLYLSCIAFGGWTMLALVGELASLATDQRTIFGLNIKLPATLMCLSFIGGLIMTAIASWKSLKRLVHKPNKPRFRIQNKPNQCIQLTAKSVTVFAKAKNRAPFGGN